MKHALTDDYRSILSHLTAYEHLRDIKRALYSGSGLSLARSLGVTDLLYAYGSVGVGMCVERNQSSVIQPWNIRVSFIGPTRMDTSSAMCALDSGAVLKDPTTGHATPDVLVMLDPRNPHPYKQWLRTALSDAYLAVTFARNPDLYVPAQRTALLMVAFVRAVEQLMTVVNPPAASVAKPTVAATTASNTPTPAASTSSASSTTAATTATSAASSTAPSAPAPYRPYLTRSHVQLCCELLYSIRDRIGAAQMESGGAAAAAGAGEYWVQLIKKLLPQAAAVDSKKSASLPGTHLTEAPEDDVVSVCKVLGPLCALSLSGKLFAAALEQPPAPPSGATAAATAAAAATHSSADKSHLNEVVLALLAEAVSRTARVHVRTTSARNRAQTDGEAPKPGTEDEMATRQFVRSALGITEDSVRQAAPDTEPEPAPSTVSHSSAYDEKKARIRSSKFFAQSHCWTNASPRAVAACVTFARLIHSFVWQVKARRSAQAPAAPAGADKKRGDVLEEVLEGRDPRHTPDDLFTHVLNGFDGLTVRCFLRTRIEPVSSLSLWCAFLLCPSYAYGFIHSPVPLGRSDSFAERALLAGHSLSRLTLASRRASVASGRARSVAGFGPGRARAHVSRSSAREARSPACSRRRGQAKFTARKSGAKAARVVDGAQWCAARVYARSGRAHEP
jgi:hypothetical protein